jgi:hypothetical protein
METRARTFPHWGHAIVALFALSVPVPIPLAQASSLKARCSQLIAYYDRFGASRSQNSDGRRNHTRISAEIDCWNGDYVQGIATMEKLLMTKKFCIPPQGSKEPRDEN